MRRGLAGAALQETVVDGQQRASFLNCCVKSTFYVVSFVFPNKIERKASKKAFRLCNSFYLQMSKSSKSGIAKHRVPLGIEVAWLGILLVTL